MKRMHYTVLLLLTAAISVLGAVTVSAADEVAGEALVAQRIFPADGATVQVPVESMIWMAEAGIEWYRVVVADGNATVYDEWLEVTANCVDGVCVAFPATLVNGSYTWQMDSWDGSSLTGLDTGTAFTLAAPATEVPFINVPQSTPVLPVREFLWEDQAQAQWYNVQVTDPGSNEIVNTWVEGRDVCQGLACSLVAPTLFSGSHILQITAWGPADTGATSASAVNFTVPSTVPTGITLLNPANGTTVPAPVLDLTWDDSPDTYWYRIFIVSTNGSVYGQWLDGAEICAGGTCTLPAVLTDGSYDVWIAGWGPANTVGTFTATSFTVGAP